MPPPLASRAAAGCSKSGSCRTAPAAALSSWLHSVPHRVPFRAARQRQLLAPLRSAADGHSMPLVVPSAVIPPPSRGSQYGRSDGDPGAGSGSFGGAGGGGTSTGQRRPTSEDDFNRNQRQGMRKVLKALALRLLSVMVKYFLVLATVYHLTSFVLAVVRTVHNTGVHLRGGGISSSEVLRSGKTMLDPEAAEHDPEQYDPAAAFAVVDEPARPVDAGSPADAAAGPAGPAEAAGSGNPAAEDVAAGSAFPADSAAEPGPAPNVRPRRVVTWGHMLSTWAAILAAPFFFSYLPDSKW